MARRRPCGWEWAQLTSSLPSRTWSRSQSCAYRISRRPWPCWPIAKRFWRPEPLPRSTDPAKGRRTAQRSKIVFYPRLHLRSLVAGRALYRRKGDRRQRKYGTPPPYSFCASAHYAGDSLDGKCSVRIQDGDELLYREIWKGW